MSEKIFVNSDDVLWDGPMTGPPFAQDASVWDTGEFFVIDSLEADRSRLTDFDTRFVTFLGGLA